MSRKTDLQKFLNLRQDFSVKKIIKSENSTPFKFYFQIKLRYCIIFKKS